MLIIQNDVGNRYSPTVIAAAITSRMGKTKLPTHIDIYADRVGLSKDSVILLEQIRTLDKKRLREKMGHLDDDIMEEVNNAIAVSFGLHEGIREPMQAASREHTPDSAKTPSGSRVLHPPVESPTPAQPTTRESGAVAAHHEGQAEG